MKNQSKTSKTTSLAASPASSIRLFHILVPFDFSEGANLALQHAIAYARQFKARVTLLHVVHLPYRGIGFGPGEGVGMEGRLLAEMSKHLSAQAMGLKRQGVPATAVVRLGYPGMDVVELARQKLVDLIIMGTHGRTGVKHVLLGSVAERVVRHAPCPVLVVRGPETNATSPTKRVNRAKPG